MELGYSFVLLIAAPYTMQCLTSWNWRLRFLFNYATISFLVFFSPFLSSFDPFTWFFFIVVTLTGYSILKFIFILLFYFSCWCDLWYFMVCNRLKNIYKYNLWACVCLVLVFSTSYFFLNGHFIFLVDAEAADEVSECFKSPRDIDVYSFSFLVYAHTVFLKSSSICS